MQVRACIDVAGGAMRGLVETVAVAQERLAVGQGRQSEVTQGEVSLPVGICVRHEAAERGTGDSLGRPGMERRACDP
jgi:hypothetical protein